MSTTASEAAKGVVLLEFWASPFAMRAKIALLEKGVDFEARHEDGLFGNKSELLLKSNPIYKKVPVLIHEGVPVVESLVILHYIEDAWPAAPLLPQIPAARARARFWADFVDKKLFDAGSKLWKSKGEAEAAAATQEFLEAAKLLEGALGESDYFGGDSFGFLDVAAVPFTSWFYSYQKFGNFDVEQHCPKLAAWATRCAARDSVANVLPDPVKVYEVLCSMRKTLGIE